MSLDDRVEALTPNVELLASMHRDNEKRFSEALLEMEAKQAQIRAESEAKHAAMRAEHLENERLMIRIHTDIRDVVVRLSVIAEAHDEKLDEHESRLSSLERKPKR